MWASREMCLGGFISPWKQASFRPQRFRRFSATSLFEDERQSETVGTVHNSHSRLDRDRLASFSLAFSTVARSSPHPCNNCYSGSFGTRFQNPCSLRIASAFSARSPRNVTSWPFVLVMVSAVSLSAPSADSCSVAVNDRIRLASKTSLALILMEVIPSTFCSIGRAEFRVKLSAGFKYGHYRAQDRLVLTQCPLGWESAGPLIAIRSGGEFKVPARLQWPQPDLKTSHATSSRFASTRSCCSTARFSSIA